MDIELLDLTIKLFALALEKVVYEPLTQDGGGFNASSRELSTFYLLPPDADGRKEVAAGLQISNAAVTKLIDRLERKAWCVGSILAPTGGRSFYTSPRPGSKLLENARRQSLHRLQAIVDRLDPESLVASKRVYRNFSKRL